MICPHCSKNLLRRQRGNRTCAYCKRRFAFDPKTNSLGLHDLRLRRLADKLGAGGMAYTQRQLWYAAARKKVSQPVKPLSGCGCGVFFALTLLVVGIAAIIRPEQGVLFGVILAAVGVLVGANVVFAVLRPRMAARAEITPPVPEARFRALMSDWHDIYHAPPPGMIGEVPQTPVPEPEAAVVCPDASVLDCLAANGIPARARLALATRANEVPPAVPVILLHDASTAGLRFAAATRAALPGRVVLDAGLRPASVQRRQALLRLRGAHWTAAELHGLGLSHQEVQWLAAGWWSPIGAVPPAKLVAAVDRALARADRSRAAEVGFMTWPE